MTRFDLRRQDCIKGMSRLGDESVDLVVTSPPYNLGIRYGKFSDTQDRESYLSWCVEWAEQIQRILKPSGSFFLNIGSAPSNPMLPHEIVMTLRDLFALQNTIHWIKSITIDEFCSQRPVAGQTRAALQTGHRPGLPSEFRIRIRVTSPAGLTPGEVISVAVATPGSFLTKRFRTGRKNDRTPQRFRFNWQNGASNCTALRASK